jgi:nucleoside-diphosphate-sugar epimerase
VYELTKLILQKSDIPIVGEGKSRWNNVHIAGLSNLYLALVESAVKRDTNKEVWGANGYMFAENGGHVWSDLAEAIAKEATHKGYISTPKEPQLGKDEALDVAGFEAVGWGLDSIGKAQRAREKLGWNPTHASIVQEIPSILEAEHQRLHHPY